jgi:hypothetical protein
LVSKIIKKNQGFVNKQLILGHKIYKMTLECLVLRERKEGNQNKTLTDEVVSKVHRSQLKEFPVAQGGTICATK